MIYRMVSAQQTNIFCETTEHFWKDAIFHSKVDMTYNKPRRDT